MTFTRIELSDDLTKHCHSTGWRIKRIGKIPYGHKNRGRAGNSHNPLY